MSDQFISRFRSSAYGAMAIQVREAARDFGARWKRFGARPVSPHRHLEAAGVLAAIVAIAIIGYNYDDVGAAWGRSLSPELARWFYEPVTRLGLSGYIFFLSGLTAIFAVLARGPWLSRVQNATLGLLAGRATFVFGATALSGLLSQIIKHLLGRARPSLIDMVGPFHFDAFALSARYASFPSGHTVTAFTVATALGWFMPKWRLPLFGLAALVGLSRVALGAHYPSDVLAGALLGIGATYALRKAFGFRRIVFRPTTHSYRPRRARSAWSALRRVRFSA
jgi:membrane-associated phospholipid phosphatase